MKFISLAFLMTLATGALHAQNVEFKLDTLVLLNNIKLPVTLMIDGVEFNEGTIIEFIDQDGDNDNIPLANIKQLISSNGVVLYPNTGQSNSSNEVDSPCSSALSSKLILDIYEAASILKEEVIIKIKQNESAYVKANKLLGDSFMDEMYSAIHEDIALLTCSNSSVDATLYIYIDSEGNFVKLDDSIHEVKNTSFYERIKLETVIPFLTSHAFTANVVTLINENGFTDLKKSFSGKIEAFDCKQEDFEEVFGLLEKELNEYDTVKVSTPTIFEVRLNYEFTKETQSWTYHKSKNKIVLTDDKTVIPGTSDTRKVFMGRIPNYRKNTYYVQYCNSKILNQPEKASINKVEKRKNKWVKVGGAGFYHIKTKVAADEHLYDLSNQYFYNFYAIYQRVGVYFGGVYLNAPLYVDRITNYEVGSLKSKEGGMYFGLTNSLFVKFGFASIKGDLHEYSNGVVDPFSEVNRPLNQLGFSTGVAFILPIVHFEMGYNQLFNSTYVGAGLNIPIKVK